MTPDRECQGYYTTRRPPWRDPAGSPITGEWTRLAAPCLRDLDHPVRLRRFFLVRLLGVH